MALQPYDTGERRRVLGLLVLHALALSRLEGAGHLMRDRAAQIRLLVIERADGVIGDQEGAKVAIVRSQRRHQCGAQAEAAEQGRKG